MRGLEPRIIVIMSLATREIPAAELARELEDSSPSIRRQPSWKMAA